MEIREMSLNDIEFFNEVRNQSVDFLHDNTQYSLEDNIKWFENTQPRFFILEVDSDPVGYFRTSEWIDNSLYIGMDIHPKFRGLGYANPAYELFINKLKDEYEIKKVYLEVLNTNKRALNIYNKLGFTIIDLLAHSNNVKSVKMELEL